MWKRKSDSFLHSHVAINVMAHLRIGEFSKDSRSVVALDLITCTPDSESRR